MSGSVNKKPALLRPVTAFIGIGSNLGKREANIRKGLKILSKNSHVRIIKCSSLYPTEPVNCEGGEFLNAVCKIETDLEVAELFILLKNIEERCGRNRVAGYKLKEARTLDLDILLFGDMVLEEKGLCVPHKGLEARGFVLAPLNEIAPDAIHPVAGKTIAELFKIWQDMNAVHGALKGIRKIEI